MRWKSMKYVILDLNDWNNIKGLLLRIDLKRISK